MERFSKNANTKVQNFNRDFIFFDMFVQSFKELKFENEICGNSITTIEANGNAARGEIASHILLRTGRVGPAHVCTPQPSPLHTPKPSIEQQ